MVAIDTLVRLALEDGREETVKVARFSAEVGLPAHFIRRSIDTTDTAYRCLQDG
jgi:hypothetical protein